MSLATNPIPNWPPKERKLALLVRRLGKYLQPPERLPLSDWAEKYLKLPAGHSKRPGPLKMWANLRDVINAIGDPSIEQVTIMKSTRVGASKAMLFAAGAAAANDPSPIGYLLPTDDDVKDVAVTEVEPLFEASPGLKRLIRKADMRSGKVTLLRKQLMGGASLRLLAASAPRKLRRVDIKYLFIDEADGMQILKEGDPIRLAIERTRGHANRKIVIASTPTEEGISVVERHWEEGDQSIYECPCPKCGVFHEIQWEDIRWPQDETGHRTDLAYYRCPHCEAHIDPRYKISMIRAGRWRALRPEIKHHRSFRINALSSEIANTEWPRLASEWIAAKRAGPSELQVFANTVLGRVWRTTLVRLDANTLMDRAEPWGLPSEDADRNRMIIPRDVLMITCGADVQDDRIEAVLLGWPRDGAPLILGHIVFDGNTLEDEVWNEFDRFLRTRWRNERGWFMGIDATAVDSGGREGRTQKVYDWCFPRVARRIYAIKGRPGFGIKMLEKAKKVKGNMRLYLVAVDVAKSEVMDSLGREPILEDGSRDEHAMRFSDSLTSDYYVQLTNEVRRIVYKHNRPQIEFHVKREGLPVEGLDATVYGWAIKRHISLLSIDLAERDRRQPDPEDATGIVQKKKKSAGDWAAMLNKG